MGQDQDDVVMLPLGTLRNRVWGGDATSRLKRVGAISVKVREGQDMGAVEERIKELLRQRFKVQPGAEDPFSVRNLTATPAIAGLELAWTASDASSYLIAINGQTFGWSNTTTAWIGPLEAGNVSVTVQPYGALGTPGPVSSPVVASAIASSGKTAAIVRRNALTGARIKAPAAIGAASSPAASQPPIAGLSVASVATVGTTQGPTVAKHLASSSIASIASIAQSVFSTSANRVTSAFAQAAIATAAPSVSNPRAARSVDVTSCDYHDPNLVLGEILPIMKLADLQS
jgi:hypothetical protein